MVMLEKEKQVEVKLLVKNVFFFFNKLKPDKNTKGSFKWAFFNYE